MAISIIAAIGKNGELGKNGGLCFKLTKDLKWFKETTMGHDLLMGLNTFNSLPGVLPGRKHYVLGLDSASQKTPAAQVIPVKNLENFLKTWQGDELFVIGGGMVFKTLLPLADKLYLTELASAAPDADVFFPPFDKTAFTAETIETGIDNGHPYTRKIYTRKKDDDLVFSLINAEKTRQSEGLELIPSENYVSQSVLRAMGSILTNKYSEGYPSFHGLSDAPWPEQKIAKTILPNHRYYGGQENIDRIERLAISRAKRLFNADHANVQPHSGANANEAAYFAWCSPGDKILAMRLADGGHLTHGAPVTRSAHIYNFIGYGVTPSGDIDYEELERLALAERPRVILIGYSAFMKIPDFARIAEIRRRASQASGQEIMLMADMAHVAGLIAGGVHPNPLDFGFDIMTTTTHKTLRGPRGGLILTRGKVSSPLKKPEKTLENLPTLIDRAVFPGTQGGPLEHIIAGKAVAFHEALSPAFRAYAKDIVKNAKALSAALKSQGFKLVGGGTENHLILIDVKESFGFDGKLFEIMLDRAGLTLNANALPKDPAAAFRPSGVRLGTPALTTRGMKEPEMQKIAAWMKQIAEICRASQDLPAPLAKKLTAIRTEVKTLALQFKTP